MVVVPIQNSIVYVQPVFLQAEQTAIPELVSVVVAYGDKMVMNSDFKTALKEVFAGGDAGQTDTGTVEQDKNGSLAEKAATLYDEALKAQKAGDWATYGSKINELGTVLEQMAQ